MVPPKLKFVSYYRVSTQRQGKSGLGLEAQQALVREYLERVRGTELASFIEVESGKHSNRPQLQAALLRCEQSRATLLVAKLDRLIRDVEFLFKLRNSGVRFQALDIPEANTLTLAIMAALAQHERELISARTKAALAARVARGLPVGATAESLTAKQRETMARNQLPAARAGTAVLQARARERAAQIRPAIEEAQRAGHTSLRAIARYLTEREIPTPRGCAWTPTAVRNVQRIIGRLPITL